MGRKAPTPPPYKPGDTVRTTAAAAAKIQSETRNNYGSTN